MYSMLYATTDNEAEAEKIAKHLLQERLIACANIFQVRSLYRWKGEIQDEDEFVLIMKTRAELIPNAIEEAKKVNSYEIPCLVSYPMGEGFPPYLKWIDEETAKLEP